MLIFELEWIVNISADQCRWLYKIKIRISIITCLSQSHESSGLENMCRLLPGNLRTMVSVYLFFNNTNMNAYKSFIFI